MTDTTTARKLIAHYVRLGGDWWTSSKDVAAKTEQVYAAVRSEILTEAAGQLLPPWEVVYESATFTPCWIADCTDEVAARGAAEAWLREHCEGAAGLVWTSDPVMAVRDWDRWLELTRTDPATGTVLATEIVVRRRAARTTTALTTLEA
jgi:hypothetical protein